MRTRFALLVVIFCCMFAAAQRGMAQPNCKTFHAIAQARWYPVASYPYEVGWSGPFMGTLDKAPVVGRLMYAQTPSVDFPPPGPVDKGKAGKETLVIFKFEVTAIDPASNNTTDLGAFQSVEDWGVFPLAPGQGVMNYTSTAKIDATKGKAGTKLEGATGFFTIAGPAAGVPTFDPTPLNLGGGIWIPEINGKICLRE
jgi:hypothetical protein